jgi:hypothetical protein
MAHNAASFGDCGEGTVSLNVEGITRRSGSWLAPIVIGVAACLLMIGTPMLWPGNVQWLTHGDLAQSYLGWAFYRHATWGWPPGNSPLYDAGLPSSVYYSDSIPLLALPFKLVSAWLPATFQYFGWWLVACFVLQAFFAWRLLGLATSNTWVRALATLFFAFAPPMIFRLYGHLALVGQWIVLAAIYLCLRPPQRRQVLHWAVLLSVAMTVHAYLFAMAAAVWLADVARRYRVVEGGRHIGLVRAFLRAWREGLVVGAAVLLAAWLAGFFVVSTQGMQADGFGVCKMNLLAPINGAGWSRLGLNFQQGPCEYEGFNYLGLGGILLVLSAILIRAFGRREAYRPLIPRYLSVVAVLLTLAAITPNIGFGSEQWHLPLPHKWWDLLAHTPLQSTGRLFWVAYYLLLLVALFVVLRRVSVRTQVLLLSSALLLQCLDLYPSFRTMHIMQVTRAGSGVPGLHGAFWDAAGGRYHTLRRIPLGTAEGWERLAFYANSHRMGMDSVEVARVNPDLFLALYDEEQTVLLTGRPEPNTMYILDDRYVSVADAAMPVDQAALFRLDGLNVLAPAWTGPMPPDAVDLRKSTPASVAFHLPFQSDFALSSAGRLLLGAGWNATHITQDMGSLSDRAVLFVPGGEAGQVVQVRLDLHRNSKGKSMAQQVDVWFEGRRLDSCNLAGDHCSLAFAVPSAKQPGYFRQLELRASQPSAKLRIALDSIKVE